jgi:hypothetical protein
MYLVEFLYPCGRYTKGEQAVIGEKEFQFVKMFVKILRTYNQEQKEVIEK